MIIKYYILHIYIIYPELIVVKNNKNNKNFII